MIQPPSQAPGLLAPEKRPSAQADGRALLAAHYALQRNCFLSLAEPLGGGFAAFSSITTAPMWNHAAWFGSGGFGEFVRTSEDWQARRNRPAVIYLLDSAVEEAAFLTDRGYELFETEAWLVREGGGGKESARVREVSEVHDFWPVFSAGFEVAENGYRSALAQAAGRMRHFVLDLNGRPAAIGTLAAKDKLAGIYNVATHPACRQQGLAAELTAHLIAVSRAEHLFLQAATGSSAERLYRKLGFQLAFLRQGYRLKPEAEGPSLARVFGLSGVPGGIARETRALKAQGIRAELLEGAWACLLHRYTNQAAVRFVVFNGEGSGQPRSIEILPLRPVAAWLETLAHPQPRCGGKLETGFSFAPRKTLSCDLELAVDPGAEAIHISYRTGLFSKDLIRRIAAHYVQTVHFLQANPNALVRDVEILPDSERQQLLRGWNNSSFTAVETGCARLFEEQVERDPEALALVLAGGQGERLTYRQLNRRANRLAHQLKRLGAGPEAPVALLLDRSVEVVVAILAVLKAGGMFVPLDPEGPAERIHAVLAELKAPIVLSKQRRAVPRACRLFLIEDAAAETNEKNPPLANKPEHGAYIIYTSGSTGRPKGVVVDHRALANHCLDCRKHYGLSPKDRVLQFSSFTFDAGLEQLLPPLISGAAVILRGEEIWTAPQFARQMRDHQLTVADLPAAYWHDLVSYWARQPDEFEHHCLRLMIAGGEALSPQKTALWQEATRGRIRLINAYGPTETVITSASHEITPEDGESATVPIGRPRADRTAFLLDSAGRLVPIGAPGELHIGGTLLARGYYRNPALTAERFIPNPFSDDPASRLYKTGDLARCRENGELEFLGRLDDQVKIRGYRVELSEIEGAFRHEPGVQDVLVLLHEEHLAAFVKGSALPADLKHALRSKLPDYMVPARVIVLSEWPLLPSGKIDRKALLAKTSHLPSEGALPKDALELQIKLIFERVLKRALSGTDQSFFELGGDSLQALELIVRIEKETGRGLPLESLYQSSTVEAVAREVRSARGGAGSSLVPLQAAGSRPPLFFLHTTPGDILGYGSLVYRLGADQPCYGLQSPGLLDGGCCPESIEEMAACYAALIRAFQPAGPYFLAGWCYGGILAVEIARLMKSQGAEVGLLALFETVAMPANLGHWRYYAHRLRRMLAMSPARWLTYAREKSRYNRNARLANRMRFREAGSGEVRDPRLLQLERVYNANMRALEQYRSRFYEGAVTLFNASERDPALIPDPQYGWVGLAQQIEIHEVPGNHDTMLTEPNVSVLARQLEDCLRRAQSPRTSR